VDCDVYCTQARAYQELFQHAILPAFPAARRNCNSKVTLELAKHGEANPDRFCEHGPDLREVV